MQSGWKCIHEPTQKNIIISSSKSNAQDSAYTRNKMAKYSSKEMEALLKNESNNIVQYKNALFERKVTLFSDKEKHFAMFINC